MKNKKKAMLKTIEALLAILITFIFIVLVFTRMPEGGISKERIDVLKTLQDSNEFRNCAAAGDIDCIRDMVNASMPWRYSFKVIMSPDPSQWPSELPEKHVYLESIFIAGNLTKYNPNIIKIYYWMK